MAGESHVTTDHAVIKRWVDERGGRPAAVKDTGNDGDPGILRIDQPGDGPDDSLEEISWDEWFDAFENNNLAFVYQDATKDGQMSHFSKLVSRTGSD